VTSNEKPLTSGADRNDTRNATNAFGLFDRYLSLSEHERSAFIERELPSDESLRADFLALVAADQSAMESDFLMRTVQSTDERDGEMLGEWRLVRKIGSGGSGVVYEATNANDATVKPVAIKVLSANLGDLRSRFLRERDILKSLNHQNIAALLDVGVDGRGAPFMVLEYVDGEPITQFADRRSLSLVDRLRLFLKVLAAVQDAHSHLIVHRDIKPSNILVNAESEPKLLDFGISKLLGDATAGLTRTGAQPMTPDYASPEQVRGETITTATDIYSLGVLLYELVAGKKPYQITDFTQGALERAICNTEPERPSRATTWPRTMGGARGLDAIVLKAMSKSARSRYASCASMAEDIARWLAGRPVAARNASLVDRFTMFCKRHSVGVAATSAATLALLLGATAFVWQAQETSAAKKRADRSNRFLLDTLSAANPSDLGRDATITQAMARAMETAEKSTENDPADRAEMWLTLATTYEGLGDFPVAKRCAESAVSFAKQSGETEIISRTELVLGGILIELRELPQAQSLLTNARKIAERSRDQQFRANTANQLGLLHTAKGDDREALRWYEIALADGDKSDIGDQAVGYANVAIKQCKLGDCATGIASQRKALALLRQAHSKAHPNVAMGLSNLAGMLLRERRADEALPLFQEALSMQLTLLGEQHPDAIYSRITFARALADNSQTTLALEQGEMAHRLAKALSPDSATPIDVAQIYGELLCRAERFSEAVLVLGAAIESLNRQTSRDPGELATTESLLAWAIAGTGKRSEGREMAQRASATLLQRGGEKSRNYVDAQRRLQAIDAMR
jgi:eukaryotic-like serine/threonine-protein kinase